MYDFSTLRPRRGMGASKWAPLERTGLTDPDVIPFSIADMDLMTAPEIVAALKAAADFGVYGYTGMDEGYRSAVVSWMGRRHGWDMDPGWIINAYGVVPAIGQAIHALTQPGEGVVFQTPAYPPFLHTVQTLGRTPMVNPLLRGEGGYTLDLEGLEALCAQPQAKLLLFCSPHNPTGRVWSLSELRQVADICNRHGVVIFSDEIHFDFTAPGHPHTVMATLDETTQNNCIVGTAASKTFNLAGLSTANIIIPNRDLRRKFRAKTDGYTGHYTGYFGLAATRAAYEQGEAWLEELLLHLAGNFTLCRDFLSQHFPSVWVAPWEGTYLLWADFSPLGLTPQEQASFFREEAQLFLNEGPMFGEGGTGFERLVLACPRHHLECALNRLDQAATRRGLPR